ncbi:MAG: hypothetical protein ACKVX9_12915 [Blastocatellia bacterium]
MDEQLQKLIRELGDAINHAIEESDAIDEVLERIRACGHDVFLVLEATIAFKDKEGEKGAGSKGEAPPFEAIPVEQRLAEISHEDRQFLKSLNIKFDSED